MLIGNVFVTGGAGFLARGLYARAREESWPCRFTAYSRDDHKHVALLRDFPEVTCVRGDVAADTDLLAAAMAGHQTVIHAAASKHVDLSEFNVWETHRNNVDGSMNVAWAAIQARVRQVVGISTDKVCYPVNTYGLSKALMEKLFIEANRLSEETAFTCTRYGNVLGSTGSVVQVWRAMLAKDGRVTATDPDMTRFWLTVDRAVDLIIEALTAPPGSVVVPQLPALRMSDLRAWFMPGVEFRYAGLRPGEKRHEVLLTREEAPFAERVSGNFWLHPCTAGIVGGVTAGYSSEAPDRYLTEAELLEMLPAASA